MNWILLTLIDSNVKEHIATFELIGGKGLYEAIVIDKITEPGFVYLKAFEPLKRQPLTETELENDSKAYFFRGVSENEWRCICFCPFYIN